MHFKFEIVKLHTPTRANHKPPHVPQPTLKYASCLLALSLLIFFFFRKIYRIHTVDVETELLSHFDLIQHY
jgi:hypothetical protein